MAVSWGPWKTFGENGTITRTGVEVRVAQGSGSVAKATVDFYVSVSPSSGTSVSRSVLGKIQYETSPGGLTTIPAASLAYFTIQPNSIAKVHSLTRDVSKSGGGSTFTAKARFETTGYGWTGYAEQSAPVDGYTPPPPPEPPPPPSAPTNLAVESVSDTQQNLTWTRNGSYTQRVQRRDDGANRWVSIATVSSSAQAYTDSSTTPGHVYEYRVTATSSGGTAASNEVTVWTTPLTPAAPSAARGADGNITVTRPVPAQGVTVWQVQRFYDGTPVSPPAGPLPASTATWLHVDPPTTQTHTYRVRFGVERDREATLWSDWSPISAPVVLTSPPLAPSDLRPTGGQDATRTVVLDWRHNPVDTTAQSAYEVRWRVDDGAWSSTGPVASTTSRHEWAPGTFTNGTTLERQVRTWGFHGDPSPWSASQVVPLAAAPVVSILSPDEGQTWGSQALTVTWEHWSATGSPQSGWRVILADDQGTPIEEWAGSGPSREFTLPAVLLDATTYRVGVEVTDGQGVRSQVEWVTVPVSLQPPPVPTLVATWQPESGTVLLEVDVPAAAPGEVEAQTITVIRADGDRWTVVATGLPPGGSTVDRLPPTGTLVTYRAVAVSALPSSTLGAPVVVDTPTDRVYLSHGPGFAVTVVLSSNVTLSRTASRTKVLHHFAGRPDPVEYAGDARHRAWILTASRWEECITGAREDVQSDWAELVDLSDAPAPVALRGPHGVRAFVSVGEISEGGVYETESSVSLPLTQVDWSEPGWP